MGLTFNVSNAMRYFFVLAAVIGPALVLPTLAKATPIPRADSILPQTTAFHLSIGDLPELSEKWRNTQLGRLAHEPELKVFADDLAEQVAKNVSLLPRVGLTWSTLQQSSFQQVDWAIVQPAGDPLQVAVVLIADCGSNADASAAFVQQLFATFEAQGAGIVSRAADEHHLHQIQWPAAAQYERGKEAFFVVFPNSQIIACDNEVVVQEMLVQMHGGRDRLRDLECYQGILANVGEAGHVGCDLNWFARPFAFAEAIRAANGGRKKRSRDLLKVLPRQGFGAIQAVGGISCFDYDKFDSLHHVFVHAPGSGGKLPTPDGERFELAARMLSFLNVSDHTPPPFVSDNATVFVSFQAKLREAFEYSESLVNDMAAADVFQDMLHAIEQDPAGPQVNLRDEFIDYLGTRVCVTSAPGSSDEPTGRLGVAIEVTDSEAVAKAIHKMMVGDPNATRIEHRDVTLWEVIDVSAAPVDDGFADFGFDDPAFDEGADETKLFPTKVYFVSQGHLFVTSSIDAAKQLADTANQGHSLAESELYRKIDSTLKELGAGLDSFRFFTHTQKAYEVAYERLRATKDIDPFADFGLLMDKLLLDGSDLPPFSQLRTSCSASGMYVRSHDDGWRIVGCTLKGDQDK